MTLSRILSMAWWALGLGMGTVAYACWSLVAKALVMALLSVGLLGDLSTVVL